MAELRKWNFYEHFQSVTNCNGLIILSGSRFYFLSYAGASAAAVTINKKAVLITGDDEFENLDSLTGFKVKYLPE